MLSATGATVGAPVGAVVGAPTISSLVLPLTSLTLTDLGIHYNRRKLLRMINLLTIYHKNKDNKSKIRENLVVAGIELFKSFEIKFRAATFHNNPEIALIKLAHDAVDRMFNFFSKNSSLLEEDDFLSSSNILKATILGKSKRYRNIFSFPHRHLGYALDDNISTKRLYNDTPLLKLVSKTEQYWYKRNNARDSEGFRFSFKWEEDVDPPICWGADEITLVGNRKYTQLRSPSERTLNEVTLFYLNREELDDKKEKILFELNGSSINKVEDVYHEEMMHGLKEKIRELEKNVMDLSSFTLVTMEELTKAKHVKRDEATLQEMDDIEDKRIVIYNRIKEDIKAANNFDIYIPLTAYYDLALPTRQEFFPLFEKVISFIRGNKQRSLLLLGELGVGKTSFLIHLTQFIVTNLFFSNQNPLIPFYIRISRLKNLKMINSEQVLKNYYQFNREEIDLLKNKKNSFCFIFDDIEVNLSLDSLFASILENFPSSYFIFTSDSLNVLSLIENEPIILNIAGFNRLSKMDYIKQYKKINSFFSLMDESEEAIYQRIQAISNLENLTDKPILLKIVMRILPLLEEFYQQKDIITGSEYIREDLLHIYTHVLYMQMAEKFKQCKGITAIGNQSLYECFLNYTINLAILMKEMDILEIDENLFFSKRVDAVKFSSLKITSEQRLLLKKFFSKKYDPILFKNNDEFKQYKYGYQGCLFLHTYGMPDNISYAFSHKEFLNYFFNFNVLRRKKIQKFINSLETKSDVILPLCQTSVQSRHSFKHSRHTSIFDQEGVHPFSYSRSTSRRESLYSQSRRSSVMSKEEGISIRKVSGQEPKVSFFTDISRTDKGKPSYLVNIAAGHSSSVAEIIDPVASIDLHPSNL